MGNRFFQKAQVYVYLSTEFLKILSSVTKTEIPTVGQPIMPAPPMGEREWGQLITYEDTRNLDLGGPYTFLHYQLISVV